MILQQQPKIKLSFFFLFSILIVSSPVVAEQGDALIGKVLYQQRCQSCHGAKGNGDGASMKSMPPHIRPKPFMKAAKVATDYEKFKELIVQGGPAFELSPLMAPNPGLTDEAASALWNYLESLKATQEQVQQSQSSQ